jgi:hypothetical protein
MKIIRAIPQNDGGLFVELVGNPVKCLIEFCGMIWQPLQPLFPTSVLWECIPFSGEKTEFVVYPVSE